MPYIVRMIKAARWEASPEERSSGELPADPLGDLRRDHPANADCVLLDTEHLDKLALRQQTREGETPNAEVNHLHRNLMDLTATALVKLGELFFRHGEFEMRLKKQMKRQIVDSIRSGAIDQERLNRKMREHLTA